MTASDAAIACATYASFSKYPSGRSTLKSLVPMNPSAHINGQPSVAELNPLRSAVRIMSSSDDRDP